MRTFLWFLALIILSPLPIVAQAQQHIQILHSNDIHGQVEPTGAYRLGGFARLKNAFDTLRAKAAERGVETLNLNAGDNLEGSLFYAIDSGASIYNLLTKLSFDAMVIGNHDWLMGATLLKDIVAKNTSKTVFLGANYRPERSNLGDDFPIVTEVVRGGIKIGILGLTTDNHLLSLTADGAVVEDPIALARQWIPRLRQSNDVVIVLSHLGYTVDKHLVNQVPGIDLVVGGHSHSFLIQPVYQNDPENHAVPIVQMGSFGTHFGRMDLYFTRPKNIQDRGQVSIQNYRPVVVDDTFLPDPAITDEIKKLRSKMYTKVYPKNWLEQIMGETKFPLSSHHSSYPPSAWAKKVVEAFRSVGKTELGVDSIGFHGPAIPAGVVTRESLYGFYPRYGNPTNPQGYSLWKGYVRGWMIEPLLELVFAAGDVPVIAGLEYSMTKEEETEKTHITIWNVNGKPLEPWRWYSLTMAELVALLANRVAFGVVDVLSNVTNTNVTVWSALDVALKNATANQPSQVASGITPLSSELRNGNEPPPN